MNRVALPRVLVTRLLRQIQRAEKPVGQGRIPATAGTPGLYWRLCEDPETPPAAAELARIAQAELYLAVCLNTKGVLQLRAWRLDGDGRVVSQEVGIRES